MVSSFDHMKGAESIHPAPAIFPNFTGEQLIADPILIYFCYAHLPAALQASSRPFCGLASLIVETLPRNAERSVALRKLLEAKDAAVRANVGAAASLASGGGSFVDRLKIERDEVNARLGKLAGFINIAPMDVSDASRDMLNKQKTVMIEYLAILDARIENITHDARLGEVRELGSVDQDRDGDPPFRG